MILDTSAVIAIISAAARLAADSQPAGTGKPAADLRRHPAGVVGDGPQPRGA